MHSPAAMNDLSTRRTGFASLWSSALAIFFPRLNSGAVWDREYARGDWDRLNADSELGRYAIVLAHVCRQSVRPSVLDIGCGSGRLLQMISRFDYERYVGLDVSSEAVERARALGEAKSSFEVGFAEEFESDRRFGVIVFNEVLYYLRDPLAVVERYQRMLDEDGTIVISMYDCMPARSVWRQLKRRFEIAHSARVTNHLKHTWDVRVVKPRAV